MEDLFYQLGKKKHFVTLEAEILLIVRRLFVLLLLIIVNLFFQCAMRPYPHFSLAIACCFLVY